MCLSNYEINEFQSFLNKLKKLLSGLRIKRGNARAFAFECQSFVVNLKLGIYFVFYKKKTCIDFGCLLVL